MSKSTIKIKCETSELAEAMLQILMMSKNNLEQHISSMLEAKGISSDTKIKVQNNEITITQKTGERGFVFISQGIGVTTEPYDTLPMDSKYMIVEKGAVAVYVKRADNIDLCIATFEDLDTAIANINSNDVEAAYQNITKPKTQEPLNGENSTNKDGDITPTV